MSDEPDLLEAGTTLLGYRVEGMAGRGGMGIVYLAWDARLKRRVAVKLIAPELSEDTVFRDRFLAESELAASLEHPNVVPVYDAGEVDGQLAIAMRFVQGTDLRRLLAREGTISATTRFTPPAQKFADPQPYAIAASTDDVWVSVRVPP
jgi:serine/threonine-protein kinase